jgi:hypothetical protein
MTAMRKFLILLAAILSSAWLMPVTFTAGVMLHTASLCALQSCQKTYGPADAARFNCVETGSENPGQCRERFLPGESNEAFFPVAASLPSENNKITVVPLRDWPAAKRKNPDASLLLPLKTGDRVTDGSATISVVAASPASQTISLFDSHEAAALLWIEGDFTYRVEGETLIPISSRITRRDLFTAPVVLAWGLLFAFIIRRVAVWWRGKLGRG